MATAQLTPARVGIHHVLIATDFSRFSQKALEFGLKLARDCHAQADIVYVMPSEPFLLAGADAYLAAREAAARDMDALKAGLQASYAYAEGRNYKLHLMEGEVSTTIIDCANAARSDLIVVGTHGRGALGKAVMGSVAERVFRASPIPVLTIGPHSACDPALAPRSILAAIDLSPASAHAVNYAVGMAAQNGSALLLLHVLSPKDVEHVPDRDCVLRDIKAKLIALVPSGAGITCQVRVEIGQVVPMILEVEREVCADLLVMGVRPSRLLKNP